MDLLQFGPLTIQTFIKNAVDEFWLVFKLQQFIHFFFCVLDGTLLSTDISSYEKMTYITKNLSLES